MHLWFVKKNTAKMPLVMSTKRFFFLWPEEDKKCRRTDNNFFFAVFWILKKFPIK